LRHGGLRGSKEMSIREVLRSYIGLETSCLDCVVLSSHSTRIIEWILSRLPDKWTVLTLHYTL